MGPHVPARIACRSTEEGDGSRKVRTEEEVKQHSRDVLRLMRAQQVNAAHGDLNRGKKREAPRLMRWGHSRPSRMKSDVHRTTCFVLISWSRSTVYSLRTHKTCRLGTLDDIGSPCLWSILDANPILATALQGKLMWCMGSLACGLFSFQPLMTSWFLWRELFLFFYPDSWMEVYSDHTKSWWFLSRSCCIFGWYLYVLLTWPYTSLLVFLIKECRYCRLKSNHCWSEQNSPFFQ